MSASRPASLASRAAATRSGGTGQWLRERIRWYKFGSPHPVSAVRIRRNSPCDDVYITGSTWHQAEQAEGGSTEDDHGFGGLFGHQQIPDGLQSLLQITMLHSAYTNKDYLAFIPR
jgi:hypothetical protein